MIKIELLTEYPKQQFNASISGYSTALIYLEYKPLQYGWFINITWGTFVIKNERVSNSFNLLRQFKDIIPFGIYVTGVDSLDPILIDSWKTTHEFWILDSTDIVDIEALYV